MKKKIPLEVRKYFSKISQDGHKAKPRPKEFYQDMQKKSVEKRRPVDKTLDLP